MLVTVKNIQWEISDEQIEKAVRNDTGEPDNQCKTLAEWCGIAEEVWVNLTEDEKVATVFDAIYSGYIQEIDIMELPTAEEMDIVINPDYSISCEEEQRIGQELFREYGFVPLSWEYAFESE